ncbi:MAG: membrane protein insertion efficiency factor YidD [Clostridiales bacterium]|nr:membrane protein insertion efficiency factor YidD [Clostridiales bacterium]
MTLKQVPKHTALGLIRFYKGAISPHLPSACRYVPTCSEYAAQAIELYGAAKGSVMGLKRILRCNPFHKGGYDPVPLPYPQGEDK